MAVIAQGGPNLFFVTQAGKKIYSSLRSPSGISQRIQSASNLSDLSSADIVTLYCIYILWFYDKLVLYIKNHISTKNVNTSEIL